MTTANSDIPPPLAAADAVGRAVPDVPSLRMRLVGAYELTKPRLNFLVLVTTTVGFYLAAGAGGIVEQPWLLLNALLGTAMTAASAAVLNQYIERDHDALMRRTALRPLPAGHLPPTLALVQGLVLGAVGTAWLAFFVNPLTAGLGLGTVLLYVLVYTPLKRRTPLNTLVGAIPGAIPPMMGVTAYTAELNPTAWALFAILFVWQMPHFYGLAMLYREDYARGGFAMLPTRPNGLERTGRQSVIFLILLLPASLLPTLAGAAGWYYAAAATALGVWFLLAGLECRRTLAPAEARGLFLTSILYLPLLLAAMMLDKQ